MTRAITSPTQTRSARTTSLLTSPRVDIIGIDYTRRNSEADRQRAPSLIQGNALPPIAEAATPWFDQCRSKLQSNKSEKSIGILASTKPSRAANVKAYLGRPPSSSSSKCIQRSVSLVKLSLPGIDESSVATSTTAEGDSDSNSETLSNVSLDLNMPSRSLDFDPTIVDSSRRTPTSYSSYSRKGETVSATDDVAPPVPMSRSRRELAAVLGPPMDPPGFIARPVSSVPALSSASSSDGDSSSASSSPPPTPPSVTSRTTSGFSASRRNKVEKTDADKSSQKSNIVSARKKTQQKSAAPAGVLSSCDNWDLDGDIDLYMASVKQPAPTPAPAPAAVVRNSRRPRRANRRQGAAKNRIAENDTLRSFAHHERLGGWVDSMVVSSELMYSKKNSTKSAETIESMSDSFDQLWSVQRGWEASIVPFDESL